MSIFDPKTKFLVLGDKPLDKIIESPIEQEQYKSYKRYIDNQLNQDVLDLFNLIYSKCSEEFGTYRTVSSVKVITNFKYDIFTSECDVYAVVTDDAGSEYRVKVCSLPLVLEDGMLKDHSKTYCITALQVPSSDITFSVDNERTKIVNGDSMFTITGSKSPMFKAFRNKVALKDIIAYVFRQDFVSIYPEYSENEFDINQYANDIFVSEMNKLINREITSGYVNLDLSINNAANSNVEYLYTSTVFNSDKVRTQLNNILNFEHATGNILAEDVVNSKGEVVLQAGTEIDKSTIKVLHRNLVDCIYIESYPNIVGCVLDNCNSHIITGRKDDYPYIPEMESAEDNGDSFILTFSKDRVIDEELLDFIYFVKDTYNTFKYKYTKSSKQSFPIRFKQEVIHNRWYPVNDIDIQVTDSIDGKVYIDVKGNPSIPSKYTYNDFLALYSIHLKLCNGQQIDALADLDLGFRKRVKLIGDFLHDSFYYASHNLVGRVFSRVSDIFKDICSVGKVIDNDKYQAMMSRYFTYPMKRRLLEMGVLERPDEVNPVSRISSVNQVNQNVNAESASDVMRRLSMGHYGRICPYETPQSQKIGLVNHFAQGCRVREDGLLETCYHKVTHSNGDNIVSTDITWLTAEEEEKYRITDISHIDVDSNGKIITKGEVLARVYAPDSVDKVTIDRVNVDYIDYVSVSTNQHCSPASTCIPFQGADDCTRVTFGLSMLKQSKSLVNSEVPIVCTTGFLNIPRMTEFYMIYAIADGIVISVTSTSITVDYQDGKKRTQKYYRYSQVDILEKSVVVRRSLVQVGQRVKKGDILISSNFVKDGIMATGVNGLVAYMTDGYNYEDGVPISKRLSDKLVSYGIHKESYKCETLSEINSKVFKRYVSSSDDAVFQLTKNGVHKIGLSGDLRGFIINRGSRDRDTESSIRYSVSTDALDSSDKLCNRHGNKGVCCRVIPNEDMFYLENGEFIDILYNPTGIISRMNDGQMFEAHVGLCAYVLGIRILCDPFNSPKTSDIKLLLSYTCDVMNSKNDAELSSIISKYDSLPMTLHTHVMENISKIRTWAGTFDKNGQAYLINPLTGKRSYTPVTIGINYVYKLVQEGSTGMHARGGYLTSEYSLASGGPTKGMKRHGGQRQGYMEFDAYAAYGTSALLQEMVNFRCDNPVGRNNFTLSALKGKDTKSDSRYIDDDFSIRRSMEYFFSMLNAMGLDVEWDERDKLMENMEEVKCYSPTALSAPVKEESVDVFKELFNGMM